MRISALVAVMSTAVMITGSRTAMSDTFVEPFDETNEGKWSWGTGNEQVSPLNGHPGAFLMDVTLNTCCPAASTKFNDDSVFTGNYIERNVTSIGIDLITLDTPFPVGSRPLSIILINDNGTPFNFNDDWGAFIITEETIPESGVIEAPAGWNSYDFDLPVHAQTVPEGWQTFDENGLGGDVAWPDLMADVSVVQWFYGDPTSFYPFFSWDVGIDNPRITFGAVCPADLNGSGAVDAADLATLLSQWGPCPGCAADLNGDDAVNASDLAMLLSAWGPCS